MSDVATVRAVVDSKSFTSDSDTEKQAKEETVYVITDASGKRQKQSFPTG